MYHASILTVRSNNNMSIALRFGSRHTRSLFFNSCNRSFSTEIKDQADLEKLAEKLEKDAFAAKTKVLQEMADGQNHRRIFLEKKESIKVDAIDKFHNLVVAYRDTVTASVKKAEDYVAVLETPSSTHVQKLVKKMTDLENGVLTLLKDHGVQKVDPMGHTFDPNLHEALFQIADPTKSDMEIIHVMQCGYKIHDRILRAAKVGICRR